MHLRNSHFPAGLALLLVLSQWLSLAHATEHVLTGQNGGCDVCTLQNHHHGTTVHVPAIAQSLPDVMFDISTAEIFYPATSYSRYGIRAPPLTPRN